MFVKGCDPEFFLVNPHTGAFISSIDKIGGSKDYPRPIGEGCAVQEDNVTVEFNIPPCENAEDFIKHINYTLSHVRERAKDMGLEVCIQPSAEFSDEELADPRALEFGCELDFNAWKGGSMNPRPESENKNLRSAGGHIHIALPDEANILSVVQWMDVYVGCMMLEFDKDTKRRELYGKPGAFRPKPYGVEYRTASNAWIQSDETIRWAWEQTDKAVERALSGEVITEDQAQKIQDCINNSDMKLLEEIKLEFGL